MRKCCPLRRSLDAADQDRALQPSSRRRVILATNIAETSLTVPDVTAVIDGGFHKVARYDSITCGMLTSLDLERISLDAADQRAGRAGRLAPGAARRCGARVTWPWPRREPDIMRIDLAAPLLDLLAWGGMIRTRSNGSKRRRRRLSRRRGHFRHCGVSARVEDRALTPFGGRCRRGRCIHASAGFLLEAVRGAPGAGSIAPTVRDAARICALLAEAPFPAAAHELTTCDLFLLALDDWTRVPPHIKPGRATTGRRRLADRRGARPRTRRCNRRCTRELAGGAPGQCASAARGAPSEHSDVPACGALGRPSRISRPRRASSDIRALDRTERFEADLRRAIFTTAIPIALRAAASRASPRVVLASGHGAALVASKAACRTASFSSRSTCRRPRAPTGAFRGAKRAQRARRRARAHRRSPHPHRQPRRSRLARGRPRVELAHWFDARLRPREGRAARAATTRSRARASIRSNAGSSGGRRARARRAPISRADCVKPTSRLVRTARASRDRGDARGGEGARATRVRRGWMRRRARSTRSISRRI